MSLFLYETHLHTSEASACANVSGREQARIYKKAGYAGIIVTDHFLTAIPRFRIIFLGKNGLICFARDMRTQKRGRKIGLSVFFGFEFNYRTTEFWCTDWIPNG